MKTHRSLLTINGGGPTFAVLTQYPTATRDMMNIFTMGNHRTLVPGLVMQNNVKFKFTGLNAELQEEGMNFMRAMAGIEYGMDELAAYRSRKFQMEFALHNEHFTLVGCVVYACESLEGGAVWEIAYDHTFWSDKE